MSDFFKLGSNTFDLEEGLNSIQPISDDYYTDGQLDEYARIDHQHPLSISLRNKLAATSRNLLDNGQFLVNQRVVANGTALGASQFAADRWCLLKAGLAAGTIVVNTSTYAGFGVSLPPGRPIPSVIQSYQVTVVSGASGATDRLNVYQGIEDVNVQQLMYGYNSAKIITFSFDVYSSVAATYVAEIFNGANNRAISASFVTTAGGWQTISLTFPGDIAGAVMTNINGAGLYAFFWLAAGSNSNGGASLETSWVAFTANQRAVGVSNTFVNTLNAIFAVTNVQLEVGQATPYEIRNFEEELDRCKRCFERLSTVGSVSAFSTFGNGQCFDATHARIIIDLSVAKRNSPTVAVGGAANQWQILNAAGGQVVCTAIATGGRSTKTAIDLEITVAAGLVGGNATQLNANNNNVVFIDCSSDIT